MLTNFEVLADCLSQPQASFKTGEHQRSSLCDRSAAAPQGHDSKCAIKLPRCNVNCNKFFMAQNNESPHRFVSRFASAKMRIAKQCGLTGQRN
jgi:hypothetical protein